MLNFLSNSWFGFLILAIIFFISAFIINVSYMKKITGNKIFNPFLLTIILLNMGVMDAIYFIIGIIANLTRDIGH